MDILKFIPEKILTGIRKKRPSMTDNEILETISSLHPGVIKNTLKISNKDSFKLINELIANHSDTVILSNKEFFKSQNDDASNVSELLTMQTSNRIMDQNKEFKNRQPSKIPRTAASVTASTFVECNILRIARWYIKPF